MLTKYGIIALIATLLNCAGAHACSCSDVTLHPQDASKANEAEGLKFSHTAEYKKDFSTAVESARATVKKHIGEKNVAVVADIDETLLDNREFFSKHPEFHWNEFNGWVAEARAPLLQETADLLAYARQNGFAIFLITGRMELDRQGTINNLVRRGVAYDGLYMRTNGDKRPAQDVKTPFREAIEKMGYKVVVNIGDQWSDLAGGHAEDCEKLPNKMYFVP